MSGFTPGPWRKSRHGDLVGSNGERVGVWDAGLTNVHRSPEAEANARLIAASPTMYEALKAARAIVADELECLVRSCSLDGTVRTLDAEAREDVTRIQASLDKIDAALTLTGART